MQKSILRFHGIGPLMAVLAAYWLSGSRYMADMLLVELVAVNILSLGANHAFGRAAGKQLSTRKVMGSLLLSILLTILAAAALWVLTGMPDLLRGSVLTVGILAIVMLVEELFASQGDLLSARLTDLLTGILLAAALLIPGDTALYCLIAAGASLAVGGAIAAGFSRHEWPKPNLAVAAELPMGLLRTALYPVLAYMTLSLPPFGGTFPVESAVIGLMILEIGRTSFERDPIGASVFRIGAGILSLAIAALSFLILPMFEGGIAAVRMSDSFFLFLAIGVAVMLYGGRSWKIFAGAFLPAAQLGWIMILPMVFPDSAAWMQPAGAMGIAILFNLILIGDWREYFRVLRVNRIRRKAMKRAK